MSTSIAGLTTSPSAKSADDTWRELIPFAAQDHRVVAIDLQETYFGYFYDLLSATPGVPAAATQREQAAAYAAPSALTAGFDWYRAFDGDVKDNQAAAAGSPTGIPPLYLRGSAERGGSIRTYVKGLRQAGLTDVRPAVIGGATVGRHWLFGAFGPRTR